MPPQDARNAFTTCSLFIFFLVATLACSPPGETSPESAAPSPLAPPDEPAEPTASRGEAPRLLTDDELADGWLALFDGETLFGWQPGSDADWRVENGSIVVTSGEPGLLCTTSQFADYELTLKFRSAPGANSGIFLRTPMTALDPASDCYELNIADSDNPFPTGSLVQRKKVSGDFQSDEWQTYQITVVGDQVGVKLDGKEVMQYTDPAPLGRGHIGLQLNSGRVEFRDIKMKPLQLKSLFNGEDLAGWKTYPDMPSLFTATEDGLLHVRNGRGQLESEESFGDFVLQLECKTHASELNSGVFFRCIPGEEMNGYECQIHNGFVEGDRAKPMDCGTGGIFRRQDARLVVADDLSWFYLTLVADGAHMAAWVNGYQVSDWSDTRPADDNPRRGLRLEPGTLMIQGHDPTTDISFRNLVAAEMAPRNAPPAQ